MKILTTAELADAFGVTVPTIMNWHSTGMPKFKRNEWDLHECLKWKIDSEINKKTQHLTGFEGTEAEWELRKVAAIAQLKEYELDEVKNDVVRHSAVDEILAQYLEPLRTIILQIPSTWALEILGLEKKEEAQLLLRQLVDQLLIKASTPTQLPSFDIIEKIEKNLEKEEKVND